jgi:acetyl-CoA carboxylase carboxyl transferase subunit beta
MALRKPKVSVQVKAAATLKQPASREDDGTFSLVASGSQSPSDDMWTKCSACGSIAFRKRVERNLNVCLKCGNHLRLTVEQRLAVTADRGTWRELLADVRAGDPLEFVDSKPYPQRIAQARAKTGRSEAITVGTCTIEGVAAALGVMDFDFMGGSMGIAVGEKVAGLFYHARQRRLPAVVFCASGGARMQEGALSLMQLAKVSTAIAALRDVPLAYISVLCDPTTGGVAASFAMLGDLNLAEPGATIGFSGRRVTMQTTKQTLPENFQTSEFLLAHGMLDKIVPRSQMRATLARLLTILRAPKLAARP